MYLPILAGSESWIHVSWLQRRINDLITKHLFTPWRSGEEFLGAKRAELIKDLEGKCLIYLDTKHWINLCHTRLRSSKALPIYGEIMEALGGLRTAGRIFCPVSSTLIEELMKQAGASRQITAQVMDLLSGGLCIPDWLDLARFEFARHIGRTFNITLPGTGTFSLWTKVGFFAGENGFEFSDACEESLAKEKAYLDLFWQMTCEEYQSLPGWVPKPKEFERRWISASELEKANQVRRKSSFSVLVRERRGALMSTLQSDLSPIFAQSRGAPGTLGDRIAQAYDPIWDGSDPHALPCVEVVAKLDAAITLDANRKADPNDMEDYFHLAQSIAHCDAVFCDNYMAQKLKNKPLELEKIYHTTIGSRPEEIFDYLKSLK